MMCYLSFILNYTMVWVGGWYQEGIYQNIFYSCVTWLCLGAQIAGNPMGNMLLLNLGTCWCVWYNFAWVHACGRSTRMWWCEGTSCCLIHVPVKYAWYAHGLFLQLLLLDIIQGNCSRWMNEAAIWWTTMCWFILSFLCLEKIGLQLVSGRLVLVILGFLK